MAFSDASLSATASCPLCMARRGSRAACRSIAHVCVHWLLEAGARQTLQASEQRFDDSYLYDIHVKEIQERTASCPTNNDKILDFFVSCVNVENST
eukprot:756651-Hanusia_phi.AAC.3